MIYPYTFFLHFSMALMCLCSFSYLFFRYSGRTLSVNHYFKYFLWYFIYNIFLLIPLMLFGDLNFYTGIYYSLAMVAEIVSYWYGFLLGLDLFGLDDTSKNFFSRLFLMGIFISALLYLLFPEVPTGSSGKWVFWYSNQAISFFNSIFAFIAGWTACWAIFAGTKNIQSEILKVRAYFFGFAAFILPFAAFYYFGAQNVFHIYLAGIFAVSGLTLLLLGNLLGFFAKRFSVAKRLTI